MAITIEETQNLIKVITTKFGKDEIVEVKEVKGKFYYYSNNQMRFFPLAKKYIKEII